MRTGEPVRLALFLAVLAFPGSNLSSARAELRHTGVNLSGAEFGSRVPGTFGIDYTYPTAAEVDHFIGKGMNTFRIPFRWERLQRSLQAELHATELSRISALVNYATDRGAHVVLDPHNFARYLPEADDPARGLIGSDVPDAAFADFWSRVAQEYRDNPRVIFNLVNEPHTMPTEQWLSAANAAIAAIRATGAPNLILVPGNAWSGAWTWHDNWYGTPNAQVMLGVVDPLNNYAYDVHQYLDVDGSGSFEEIVSATVGSERLAPFTRWLRDPQRRFANMDDFASALDRWRESPTGQVRPGRSTGLRPAPRPRTLLAATTICLFVAILGWQFLGHHVNWGTDVAGAWQRNTVWTGIFRFRPPIEDYVGDVRIAVTAREGSGFSGTYATEDGAYVWEIAGSVARNGEGDSIKWRVVRAMREREPRPMMLKAHAVGTVDGEESRQILKIPGTDNASESIADLTLHRDSP